ncbi:small ribosomal subunit protein mS44 [Monosporozyma unispora]|nr:hypothetical protein C6P44_004674 [Kazachstania unispora]
MLNRVSRSNVVPLSRRVISRFQSSTISQNPLRIKLDEYLTYYKTPMEMRPYIYRPKNHNKLLTMSTPIKDDHGNIIDHETPAPRDSIRPISSDLILQYINSVQDKNELMHWLKEWTNVTTRKKTIWKLWKPIHLQQILLRSFFELGGYSNFLGFIYTQKNKFIDAKNGQVFNIENFLNTVLLCNLLRDHLTRSLDSKKSLQKLKNAWSITQFKTNRTGLVNVLIQSLEQRQRFTALDELKSYKPKNLVLPIFPSPDSESFQLNKDKFLKDNELVYIISKSLLEQIDKESITLDPQVIKSMQDFVTKYIELSPNEPERFDDLFKSMHELYKKDETSLPKEEEAPQTKSS